MSDVSAGVPEPRGMRVVARVAASVVIGFLLLTPLGALYGALHLPVYHAWGLMHGAFFTALPALVAAAYVGLGLAPWFGKSQDALPRLLACACVFVLVTALFRADQESLHTIVSRRHLLIYAGLCLTLAALCAIAERPVLVPLFLLVPLGIDPVFGLLMAAAVDSEAIPIAGLDFVYKVAPAAVAAALAVAAVSLYRARKG